MNFISGTPIEHLETIGDEQYIFFVDALSEIHLSQEEYIFLKIAEFNEWTSMFPSDSQFNGVELNEDLIDQIFDVEEWHFSKLIKKSGHKRIVRNLYNVFFVEIS